MSKQLSNKELQNYIDVRSTDDEIFSLARELLASRKAIEVMREGLGKISKPKYGLQGYYEEEDYEGGADYLTKLAFEYEATARDIISQADKILRGEDEKD